MLLTELFLSVLFVSPFPEISASFFCGAKEQFFLSSRGVVVVYRRSVNVSPGAKCEGEAQSVATYSPFKPLPFLCLWVKQRRWGKASTLVKSLR